MAQDSGEVVVGANGAVYVAPEGSTLPTTPTAALDPAFVEVGFVSEEGVTFTDSMNKEAIEAWQSFYPIRRVVASKESSVEFVMRQWNADNIEFAFGGGAIADVGGVATFTPPAPGDAIDYRALVIEWNDGDKNYRLVVPRGDVSGEVSAQLVRTSAADLPINFAVSPEGEPVGGQPATQPWFLITDDPAIALST